MVDVDHRAGMLDLGPALTEAPEGGAVEREDDVTERGTADLDGLESRQVLEQARQRIGDDHANLSAHRAQRDGKAEGAPEAVGVGILVREAGDLIGAVDDGAKTIFRTWEARDSGQILQMILYSKIQFFAAVLSFSRPRSLRASV